MSRPNTGSVAPNGTWLSQRSSMSHSSPPARPKKNAGMRRSHMNRSVVETAPRLRRSASTTTRGICGRSAKYTFGSASTNLSQRREVFDLDPILVPARRAFHRDEVVERGDHDLPASDIHFVGVPFQEFVIEASSGVAKAVEVPVLGLEREVEPITQGR